jgi:hypothetical protein
MQNVENSIKGLRCVGPYYKSIKSVKANQPELVVQFQSAMSINVEKDSSLPLGMTTKLSICHLEPFGETQGKLRERSFPN